MIYQYNSVSFREPRMEDAAFLQKFLTESADTQRCLGGWVGELTTLEAEQEYLRGKISGSRNEHYFAILDCEDRLIGSCSIFDWDARCQKCTIGIFIADPEARGKGCGSDAIELLLLIAFTELNSKKVKLSVYDYNKAAIHLYEKKGFVCEGTLHKETFTAGNWHDEHLYALFYEDWLERVRREGRKEKI